MAIFDKGKRHFSEHSSSSDGAPRQTVTRPPPTPEAIPENTALIGETITITGEVRGNENLIIDGHVEGPIDLQHNKLAVGKSGAIISDISSAVVEVQGLVKGDITSVDKVIITNTGTVYGNIVSPRVTLEDGAKFQGRIDMIPKEKEKSRSSAATQQGNQKEKSRSSAATQQGNQKEKSRSSAATQQGNRKEKENQKEDQGSADSPAPKVTTSSTPLQFKQSKSGGIGLDSLKAPITEPKEN